MVFGSMPDDSWFSQVDKQLQGINGLVNLNLVGMVQHLAGIDAAVKAMRMVPALQVATMGGQIAQHVVGIDMAMKAISLAPALQVATMGGQVAQLFATLPAYVFENLMRSQETWLQSIRFTEEFFRLQHLMGTNLIQMLSEHAARYRVGFEERDAFTQAFSICYEELLFCAMHILRNFHDAEDTLQDASEKALIALATYSPERLRRLNIRAWFVVVVKNTAKNALRNRFQCTSYETNWMEHQLGSSFDQPEVSLLRGELFQAVGEAFRTLPELQHRIIFLRYFGYGAEMNWEELAGYLHYPPSTVRSYYTRGLKTLRKQLERLQFSATDLAEAMNTFSLGFHRRGGFELPSEE